MTLEDTRSDDKYYADEFDDPVRNLYEDPQERALIRTEDVYQTEVEQGTIGYSETLLSVIATYQNSGKPEGFNAQCMVGKSKRGEVALRLFAVINPQTHTFEKAGFKTRGCLAVTACASVICSMIEGKTFQEALAITTEDITQALDGVPWDKAYTPQFAVCGVRALIGDFYVRQGMGLQQLNNHIACDEGSVACLICEHCSLRTTRIELMLATEDEQSRDADTEGEQLANPDTEDALQADGAGEQRAATQEQDGERQSIADDVQPYNPALAEHNAIALVLDDVRACSKAGKLSTAARWASAGLVPQHMSAEDLEMQVFDYLQPVLAKQKEEAHTQPAALEPSTTTRHVGIPSWFTKQDDATPDKAQPENVQPAEVQPEAVQPEAAHSQQPQAKPRDEVFGALDIPQGYRLVEQDGEVVLVETGEVEEEAELPINTDGIQMLMGHSRYYLYDETAMTPAFAHWAFLAAEGDDLVTFADLVRQESRIYPRPMPIQSLQNRPFNKSADQIEAMWKQANESGHYPDLKRTQASNGDVFFYSTDYLSDEKAQSLAEWHAVERRDNL